MSNHDAHQDKRRHARFELLEYALVFRPIEIEAERAVVVDISLGGLQTRSRGSLAVGEQCLLTIGQGNDVPLRLTAEVRHSRPVDGSDLFATGFRFLPASSEERMALVNYIHNAFQRQGESLLA